MGLFVLNKMVLVYGFGFNPVSWFSANAYFRTNLVTMAMTVIKILCECLLYCQNESIYQYYKILPNLNNKK